MIVTGLIVTKNGEKKELENIIKRYRRKGTEEMFETFIPVCLENPDDEHLCRMFSKNGEHIVKVDGFKPMFYGELTPKTSTVKLARKRKFLTTSIIFQKLKMLICSAKL